MMPGQRTAMEQQLTTLVTASDLAPLANYLGSISNAAFRMASTLLAERVLTRLEGEDFWRVFSYLALLNPKAYLGTCLKAAATLWLQKRITFASTSLESYAAHVTSHAMDIDRRKCLAAMLPLASDGNHFAQLWHLFAVETPEKRIALLAQCNGIDACYEIFREAKRIGDNHDFLLRTCNALIRKGDSLSFNLASILRSYFALNGVGAVFSLNIEPYKLSYLDTSPENFKRIITSL